MNRPLGLLLLMCLITLAGCGLMSSKGDSGASNGLAGERLPAAGTSASRNGVLAGQVIDTFNQRRPGVNLTLQPVDGGSDVQAVTNDQGYFTVNGLQTGKRYRIQAKSASGSVTSTGTVEATAPNVVVLIRLNDKAGEADGKPTGISGSVGGKHSSIASADESYQPWSRGNPAATGRGDRLGAAPDVVNQPVNPGPARTVNPRLGRPVTTDVTPPRSTVPVKDEYVTQVPPDPRFNPPPMTINGPGTNSPGEPNRTRTESPSNNFFDFPLLNLEGQPTTIANYRGRLTLVDFWNTDCEPCLRAMPELMKLQRSYRQSGLIVIGIAINEKGKQSDNADKIRWRTGQKGVDYPLLMEKTGSSVTETFKIEQYPTLLLLDEAGRELWRHVGFNPDAKRALETELQKRLR